MKTVLNIKMDSDLKSMVQRTAEQIGLPVSLVFTNLAKQFVQEKSVTFSLPEIPNKKTAAILDETEMDSKLGVNLSKPLRTPKEIRDHIMNL